MLDIKYNLSVHIWFVYIMDKSYTAETQHYNISKCLHLHYQSPRWWMQSLKRHTSILYWFMWLPI